MLKMYVACATTSVKSKNRFGIAAIDRLLRYLVATNVATKHWSFTECPKCMCYNFCKKNKNRFAMADSAMDMLPRYLVATNACIIPHQPYLH